VIFLDAEIAVLNKVDLIPYLDVDVERLKRDYQRVRKHGKLHLTSAKTGEGIDELLLSLGFGV